jgi:dTDP-glucose 4,6-dehydratase
MLVTGGAGFIGSHFVLDYLKQTSGRVINLDKLTYAGNLNNLALIRNDPRHIFVHGDIADRALVRKLLNEYRPVGVVNFAAESHVDRSILTPGEFIQTNIVGVFHLLEEIRAYFQQLSSAEQNQFRFLHVSTDEVYGSLALCDPPFTEETPYRPNSPYAASKAGSDHLVRAYHHTYGLPTLTTNCSNNYGPHQYPEKLIPLMILNALQDKPLPIYGEGANIRDWLYVGDHCAAIRKVLAEGRLGETYNIGGQSEKTNLEVAHLLCAILDEIKPRVRGGTATAGSYRDLIQFVKDRPGHDYRYAIATDKIKQELGWKPEESFESGLRKTILWYVDHREWSETQDYKKWIEVQYQ